MIMEREEEIERDDASLFKNEEVRFLKLDFLLLL